MLRTFMLFQHMRTEAASRRSVEMFAGMEHTIGTPLPDFKPSIKEAVQFAMRAFAEEMHLFDDLKVCLVRNRTSRPFVTSDDPAVIANRWHKEDPRVRHKSPGLMACGTSVFLPLSPRTLCVAYDGNVYSMPHQNGWTEVRRESDVNAFNEQQFLNASANVYFRDWRCSHRHPRGGPPSSSGERRVLSSRTAQVRATSEPPRRNSGALGATGASLPVTENRVR